VPSINLLPWREERREASKKKFFMASVATLGLAIATVFIWDVRVTGQIKDQIDRNEYLKENIARLQEKVGEVNRLNAIRNRLIERMTAIGLLQDDRPTIVRVLDQLVRTLPDGVFYTDLTRTGNLLTVEGIAESNNYVSRLMRELDASLWLWNPNLDAVQAVPEYGDLATNFKLAVSTLSEVQGPVRQFDNSGNITVLGVSHNVQSATFFDDAGNEVAAESFFSRLQALSAEANLSAKSPDTISRLRAEDCWVKLKLGSSPSSDASGSVVVYVEFKLGGGATTASQLRYRASRDAGRAI